MAPLSRGAQSGDAAERSQKASNVKSIKEKSSPFFFFCLLTECTATPGVSQPAFSLVLGPKSLVRSYLCNQRVAVEGWEGRTHFPADLDNLGGFGGALNHPTSGCRAPSGWGGSGREVGLGRVAQECHLQDCRYLFS